MTRPFQIEHVRISPEAQIPAHAHEDTWELAYIIQGSGTRTTGESMSRFSRGDVVLTPPRVTHYWKFDPNDTLADGKIENLVIFINETWLSNFALSEPILGKTLQSILSSNGSHILHGRDRQRVASLVRHAESDNESHQALRIIEALVAFAESSDSKVILHKHTTTPEAQQQEKFRIFIDCNYMRRITLADAAAEAGISRSLFCLRFKELMGMTFVEYLNSVRIRNACRLLKHTTMSISMISDATGFDDASYFNRVFKRETGISPREWRNTNGNTPTT